MQADPTPTHPAPPDVAGLNTAQWRGLARLGDALARDDAPDAEALVQSWRLTTRLAAQTEALRALVNEHLAHDLTGWIAAAGSFVEREQPGAAMLDLLVTVAHLHRNGTLKRLRELSDILTGLGEGVETDALLAGLVRLSRGSALSRLSAWGEAIEAAAETATEAPADGGLFGLLRTLRDPNVQRSLQMLARIPEHLREVEHPDGATPP